MANSSFYNLNLNDFGTSIRTAWEELRQQNDFCDVTLACEGKQIEAHKVILSGFSPVFKDLLKQNTHPHPLLYLRGVKYCELVNILDFIYQGEISIEQEQLNSFVDICREFQIKGLAQDVNIQRFGSDDQDYPQSKKRKITKDNEKQLTFIKSEPNLTQNENDFYYEHDEDTTAGLDYEYFKEDKHQDLEETKEENWKSITKKRVEMMPGPKPIYEFLRNPKSSQGRYDSPGVLILNQKFIFHFSKWASGRENAHYVCSHVKSTGCKAKATVSDSILVETDGEQNEEESTHGYILTKWSQDDDHTHEGMPGRVFAEKIMIDMIDQIEADPSLDINKVHTETLDKYRRELGDEDSWSVIMESVGKKNSSLKRLRNCKAKALGTYLIPKSSGANKSSENIN